MTTVVQIPNLPAAISLSGSEMMEVVQAGVSSRATVQQVADVAVAEGAGVYVKKTGDTMTGNLTINDAIPTLFLNSTNAANACSIVGQKLGGFRWKVNIVDSAAETGGNVGSDLNFYRYDDSGNVIGQVLNLRRSDGAVRVNNDFYVMQTSTFESAVLFNGPAVFGDTLTAYSGADVSGGLTADSITTGALTATGTVSGAGFTALLAPYAKINSQVFTGTPSLPTGTIGVTQAPGDSSTKLATTAFVGAATTALGLGTMATQNANNVTITGGTINGTSVGATTPSTGKFTTLAASGVVSGVGFTNLLAPYALVDSQVFTGTPSLPTGTIGVTQLTADSTTKLATTAFVKAQGYATTASLGTMSTQNANSVAITGGAIDGVAIGATTRSSGAFTTLAANGAATFTGSLTASPANANVTFSPTGTGTVTINPATLGHVDNTAIGATTASTGAFTTLSATTSANFTTSGTVTINPTTLGNINNTTIGGTTAAAGTFTNLTATGTVSGAGFTTLLNPYALVNSQVFTGTPSLPTGTIGVTQAAATNNTTLATTAYVKSQNYLTANQSIALTGDVTGSGTTSIASTVVQLQGRPLSASLPASGNLMGWNGTTWGPVAAGAAAAGGTANQIQYNNGGVLGGLPTTGTFAGSNVVMSIAPTLTNSLNITGAASNDSTLVMNKSASLQQCRINAQMGGVSRWQMMLGDTTAEGGSNAGSDFTLSRFTDAGGALDSPLKIIRSTGVATFTQALFSANHTITGAAGNNAAVIVNKAAAGFYSGIDGQTAGSRRWLMMLGNATAEGGSNAGSDFMINRYTDAAGFIDTPLTITRSSGDATFSAGLYVLNSAVTAKQIVINGAALGSVAGNIQTVFAAGSTTTNGEQLRSEVQRKSAGSDWTTAAWQTYRVVDGTKMGYVEYGSQAVKPIAFGVATTELASISSTGVFTAASTLVGTGAVLNAPAATDSVLWLNKPASGRANAVYGQMAASNRWALTLGDTTAESGSNLGSNYVLSTFTDAGAFLGNPLVVSRASGYAYFNANGATSALSYDAAPYGHSAIRVNKAGSGKTSQIAGLNNGLVRWVVDMGNGNTETGTGNTGSDFVISRCNDAGAGLDSPLQILRSTGVVTFVRPITIQNFDNLGHLRLVGGNYGATIRNDGSACYLLQTASGDQYGAFNSARPFSWNLSSGAVNIDGGAAGTTFGGPITTTGQIFTSGNVIGGSLYASNGQITTYAAAANGFYNLCDGAGNNGQVCTMTFRGLGSGFSAQVNLAQITFAAVAATANGTLDVLGGENGRQGPYGTQGQVNTAFWNGANLEWRIGGTFVGYVQFISDYRVKQNVAALPSMWDRIKALNPISYELQDYTPPEGARNIAGGRDNPKQLIVADGKERWGFVAHELQEALTEDAATGVKDAPDMLQAPNPWTVIAALTKALQEAMARIEALEARA